jgi:hypothetical protein
MRCCAGRNSASAARRAGHIVGEPVLAEHQEQRQGQHRKGDQRHRPGGGALGGAGLHHRPAGGQHAECLQ